MFDIYVALGDSMSIDFYPAQDAESAGISTNEEIGAASLFYRNDSDLFPEFAGQDLSTEFPGIKFQNLAFDGATCEDLNSEVRWSELSTTDGARVLVTLTLGGNDLLNEFRRNTASDLKSLNEVSQAIGERYFSVVQLIQKKLPNSLLIITSVFDPTDGTGILPISTPIYNSKLPIEYLITFNRYCVERIARSDAILFADVYKHFQGHGAECGASDQFWFWKPSPIEPSYQGASEIRRVWLTTLRGYLSNLPA